MRAPACVTSVVLVAALAGCAAQSLSTHDGWYESFKARPPAGGRIHVCHGFTCRLVTRVDLSDAELQQITAPLAVPAADAAGERTMISRSVQAFETVIGRRVGTSADRGGLNFGGHASQMDCIDEATNTTSLLLLLEERGHLRHHRPMHPVSRGLFLDGRYPHNTAVVAETRPPITPRTQWAIDSWPAANAEPPVIQRLDRWLAHRPGDPSPSG
jgi:hypothetical protein